MAVDLLSACSILNTEQLKLWSCLWTRARDFPQVQGYVRLCFHLQSILALGCAALWHLCCKFGLFLTPVLHGAGQETDKMATQTFL